MKRNGINMSKNDKDKGMKFVVHTNDGRKKIRDCCTYASISETFLLTLAGTEVNVIPVKNIVLLQAFRCTVTHKYSADQIIFEPVQLNSNS